MVGSIRRIPLCWTALLWLAPMVGHPTFAFVQAGQVAPAEDQKPAAPPAPPRDTTPQPGERSRVFGLTGEEPAEPFVPLHPRTVEDRKRLEALTDYTVARALEDRKSWNEAVALLEKALAVDPDSVTVLRRLSSLCFILGRTDTGVSYSKKVLAVDPGDTETISRLVGYYNRRNEPAGAESVLRDVLANPKLDEHASGRLIAEYELGKLYAGKLQKPDKAADCFAKVVAALDDRAANRLSPADQRRILGSDEAAAYQEFGETFLEAKRLDLAVKAFERGLDYDPEDPQLPLLLSDTLLKANQGGRALTFVEQFLKRQPQGVEGYDLLAKVLKALKREGEITPRLEAAAKTDSKNVALQYILADRYREVGQVEKAETMYKQLLASQPTTQGYGALAASLFKRRKPEELLKVISEAVARPGGLEAVQESIKGVIADPAFAARVLEAGKKLQEAEPPGLSRQGLSILAYIATRTDKLDAFLPVQKLELKRNPSPQTYKEFATLLIGLHKYAEVASTLEEMMTRFPAERNARVLAELAINLRKADKPDAAIKAAREALTLEPNDLDARVQLALLLSQNGKADEAVAMLREAMKKEPGNPALGSILGNILSTTGKNDEALALFKGLLDQYPNNDEVIRTARSNLSVIYVNLGDYAKGEAELEALLERNPDEVGVNNDLGYLYAEQGKNLEKAEAMIRKAVSEEPENSAYLDSLGWVLFKRGKAKEAVEPLEKAVQKLGETAGTDATILEHLGDVYFALQDTAKAKQAWQSAEKTAAKTVPPDKRLPEIRKKLATLETLGPVPKPSTDQTP